MADSNNPFGGYTGKTVKDVTSSMWEPISAGPSPRKEAPAPRSTQQKKKKPDSSERQQKKQPREKKHSGADVTQDRISEGGKKTKKAADDKKKKSEASPGKKKSPQKGKVPVGSKKREPKGRDTRNPDVREEQARARKEEKRVRDQAKSREKAKTKSRQGVSYDEMRNDKSKVTRLRAKIIAVATVVITFFTLLCCAGVYVYQNGATVTSINIVGENRYKDEKIIETAGVYVGINMLSVREKAVNEAVTKALPYIKEVEVEYQLPDVLVFNITPTTERLLIAGSTGYICLDEDGKILSLNKKKLTDGRYLIEGFEDQPAEAGGIFVPSENNKEKYEKVKEIVSILEKSGKFPKGAINVSDLKDVKVIYDSRICIYLGDCERLESQVESAINIIEIDQDIINGQTGYIETRYEGQTTFKPGNMQK